MADRLTLYDYLAFVLPGGTILFVAIYGHGGWPHGEPGPGATIGLLAACFVVGYMNAAVGNWVESAFLGSWPGRRVDPLWGTLGSASHYASEEREAFKRLLRHRYPDVPVAVAYRLAHTELQQRGLDGPLNLMNQHIGFSRGMATATSIAVIVNIGIASISGTYLPLPVWIPVLAAASASFIVRYRRFWRRFGDTVLRGVGALAVANPQDGR